LDELSGANVWRNDPTSTAFNYRLVATRLARLKELGTTTIRLRW
jgi:hypothetical protein